MACGECASQSDSVKHHEVVASCNLLLKLQQRSRVVAWILQWYYVLFSIGRHELFSVSSVLARSRMLLKFLYWEVKACVYFLKRGGLCWKARNIIEESRQQLLNAVATSTTSYSSPLLRGVSQNRSEKRILHMPFFVTLTNGTSNLCLGRITSCWCDETIHTRE